MWRKSNTPSEHFLQINASRLIERDADFSDRLFLKSSSKASFSAGWKCYRALGRFDVRPLTSFVARFKLFEFSLSRMFMTIGKQFASSLDRAQP